MANFIQWDFPLSELNDVKYLYVQRGWQRAVRRITNYIISLHVSLEFKWGFILAKWHHYVTRSKQTLLFCRPVINGAKSEAKLICI
jgi:hypothetical protein